MSTTYTWRPTGGNYYSSSGSSASAGNHYYYSSNRTFRMDFPDLGGLLGKDKKTLSIASAILRVYITTAHSATLTIGYSYKTAYADRKSMLASVAGIKMNTSTGWMNIDLMDVIKAYCKDGTNSTMRLWGYGTGGSSSNSNFRGYSPSSSYSSQCPYITLAYDTSIARIYTNGTWETAVPYVYHNGVWQPAVIQMSNNCSWS